MKPQNEPPITDLEELMALFDFDAHDLAENRAGRMSARQRERAEAQTLTASIEKTATTISLPVIPLVTLPYLILVTRYGDEWGAGVLLAIVVWFGIMALCFWLVYRGVKAWLHRAARDRSHWLLRRLGRLDRRIDAPLPPLYFNCPSPAYLIAQFCGSILSAASEGAHDDRISRTNTNGHGAGRLHPRIRRTTI
jgi:hypothetical protein